MGECPPVTIVLVTYNRPEEIRKTITALRAHIQYQGALRWLVADDGSPGTYTLDLLRDFREINLHVEVTQRGGWGKNVNAALKQVETEYFFLCEDDYVSLYPIDLNAGVKLMARLPEIGMVRYDGIEGHDLDLSLRTLADAESTGYAVILPTSPSLYVYSNRPHLCHRRFYEHYGPYPEGLRLGATEESYAHTVYNGLNAGGPQVAILHTGIPRGFDHIGKSYQLSAEDVRV